MKRIIVMQGRSALLWGSLTALGLCTGCLSPEFTITTSGKFNGTYVSMNATYSGPLGFTFTQADEDIQAEGTIVIDDEVVDFQGEGTLTKDPMTLDLDAWGTDFILHIEGQWVGGRLTGSYTFQSDKWGDDSGTIDLGKG